MQPERVLSDDDCQPMQQMQQMQQMQPIQPIQQIEQIQPIQTPQTHEPHQTHQLIQYNKELVLKFLNLKNQLQIQKKRFKVYRKITRLMFARLQTQTSKENRYQAPENYLEVTVSDPQLQKDHVDYLLKFQTNLPIFRQKDSSVRRRYSDFERFRDLLVREDPKILIPPLPGKVLTNRFADHVIEARRLGLERFIQIVAGHPLIQTGSKVLALIQSLQSFLFNDTFK